MIGSIVTATLSNGWFFLLLELHRKESVPAARAAGLFSLSLGGINIDLD